MSLLTLHIYQSRQKLGYAVNTVLICSTLNKHSQAYSQPKILFVT